LLGERFAGAWFDPDDGGRLKNGITRAAAPMSADVRRIVSEFVLGDDAQLASVRFTVAELERRHPVVTLSFPVEVARMR
jgi:hypothetical protein